MSKFILGSVSLALLIFLIVWLWQRQPSTPEQTVLSQKTESETNQNPTDSKSASKPQDNLVVATEKIKIKGILNPSDYLIIASNNANSVTKAGAAGDFEVEVTLQSGLNLIDYISTSSDLKNLTKNPLTFYYSPDKKFKSVYAGSVKSIFDSLLTITTSNSEINARTSRSTELDIPTAEEDAGIEESTSTALRNIRVGDYAISLGENSDQNTQISESLTIIRKNVPQNNTRTVTAQIASIPKQNIFTAKNLSDSKAIELTLTKITEVQTENQIPPTSPIAKASPNTPASQIIKDKNAIIIYHEENGKNIVDLIYILS